MRCTLCVLATLTGLASCQSEEPQPRVSICADRENSIGHLTPPVIGAKEMAEMTEEQKRITREHIADIPGYRAMFHRICDLSDANSLPGIGSLRAAQKGEFWFAHARADRPSVLEIIAPAVKEQACDKLGYMRLTPKGRNKFQYFFCSTGSGFELISAYEARGDRWAKLE